VSEQRESEPAPEPQPGGGMAGVAPPIATATALADVPDLPRHPSLFWWLTVVIIAADQISKALVRSVVALYDSHTVIPGLLDLAHVRNEGVAFGLFNSSDLQHKWILTTGLALAALAGITYYARHIREDERLARIGLSMILGGAIGNLIDRVRNGYVLDFVDVYFRGWHFWAFNVADACITFGALFVFFDLLFVRPHASHSV
jgi:signal peptidase II